MDTSLQVALPPTPGQALSNTPLPTALQNNVAASIGNLASQQILSAFNQNAYNVPDFSGGSKTTIAFDSRFMTASENRFLQYDIANASGANRTVIFGSVLGIQGNFQSYGQPASACDFAGVTDTVNGNTNAFVLGVQGLSTLTNLSSIAVGNLKIISDNTTQQNQNWTYFDLAYDFTLTSINQNTTGTFTRFDNDQNVVQLNGAWTLSPHTGVKISSINAQSMQALLYMTAEATVKSFRVLG